jgi:outer membrane usher protein
MEPVILDVTVNGVPGGEPVLLLKDAGGRLYASREALARWRIRFAGPGFTRDGIVYYPLGGVSGLVGKLVEADQTLHLTAEARLLEPTSLSYQATDPGPMTPSAVGGFLNYDLLGMVADGEVTLSGAVELGVFTPLGVGVSNFVGRWRGKHAELTRLDTNWTWDDPARLRSFRIGDSISRGGVGGAPLRFGGIQLSRDFAVQPGFVTLPLPSVAGSAAVPSVVDVYVNNVLADSRDVPPGPFRIAGVPVATGGGEVQLVVRDLLGREVLLSQSYYTGGELLRRGLHDYSYEAGLLRHNFGRKSNDYGGILLAATHRYGFSDQFTGELHVEATADVQVGGAGATAALPGFGMLEASIVFSNSALGQGRQIALGFERRTPRLSFGIFSEFASANFVPVGAPAGSLPAAASLRASAGLPVGFGSLALTYLWRNGRNEEPDIHMLTAHASLRLGRIGSLHLTGRQSFAERPNSAIGLALVVPLGGRTSANAGAQLGRGGFGLNAAVQKNLPAASGFGYRADLALGETDRFDGRLTAQTSSGTYDAEVSWVDGATGVRMTASGGIGAVRDHVFASRKLTQSFATVQVGNYPGVSVYADNQLVGVTDASGRAVVPRLRPFDRNTIRIEADDLPLDAQISEAEQMVRPHRRTGVAIDFGVKRARGAVLVLRLEDGGTVPAGSTVRIEGRADEFITAPGGEVYLTGLERENTALATWSGGECAIAFRFTEHKDPQPHLGEIPCRAVSR